ncbi:Oryzin [Drechslerella dactyloides]|uniref:Oryzin n=1 Tax=Drechslerella dactyloides TaxID=74499 RepID=A0AAD6J5Z7_DREDA|nr:Oryzin [Drechslerella dactyloides]
MTPWTMDRLRGFLVSQDPRIRNLKVSTDVSLMRLLTTVSSTFSLLAAVLPFINFAGVATGLPFEAPAEPLSVQPSTSGKFIVVLKSQVSTGQLRNHTAWAASVHARNLQKRQSAGTSTDLPTGVGKTYDINKFKAYAGSFDAETLVEIKSNDDVDYIEEEQSVWLTGVRSQTHAPWGLSQISNKVSSLRPIEAIGKAGRYHYDATAGEGMYVYVLDTGIYTGHREFEGRAEHGYTAVPDADDADNVGHGSHVAGIAVGKRFGVAKKARVISVKVIDGNFSTNVIAMDGFRWAVEDIIAKNRQNTAVINMSIVRSFLDDILTFSLNFLTHHSSGTPSASNRTGPDPPSDSPASAISSITVGALNSDGTRYQKSNFGDSVAIWAPGSLIPSAGNTENSTIGYSGTSQAAPHVAGLISYLRALEGINGTDAVWQRLLDLAQKDVLKEDTLMGSPNVLAFNGMVQWITN